MSGYGLGVDLGTTHTAAAVLVGGRVELVRLGNQRPEIPSLVFVTADSAVLVGDAAERRGAAEPERLAREFKRRLGDPVPLLVGGSPYPAHALMAKLLRRVHDIVERQYDERPRAITVTHPANWGPFKRELLDQAIHLADIDEVLFLPEPEAAAIHYATTERVRPGETVAVYDLGGGTFDAAVLRRTETGFSLLGRSEGIEQLGGIDFDEAVFAHVLTTIGDSAQSLDPDDDLVTTALSRLRRDCTEAKEALSFDTEVMIPVALPGLHTRVRLNRSEFEAMIGPALSETVAATARALRAAGVSPDELRSVVLAGGSSRIPLVSQLLDAEFGRPVTLDPHPEHSVAMGAAATTGPLALGAAPARPTFAPSPPTAPPRVTPSPSVPRFRYPATPAASGPAAGGSAGSGTGAGVGRAAAASGPVPRTSGAGPAFGATSGSGSVPRADSRGRAGAGSMGERGAPGPPTSAPGAGRTADPDSTTQLPPATDPDGTGLLPSATDAAPASAVAADSPPATPPTSQPSSGRPPSSGEAPPRATTPPARPTGSPAWPPVPPTWRGAAPDRAGAGPSPARTGTSTPSKASSGEGGASAPAAFSTAAGGAATAPADGRPGAARAARGPAAGRPVSTGSPVHVNRAVAPARPTTPGSDAGPASGDPFATGSARVRPAATPAPGRPRELPPALAAWGPRLAGLLRGRRRWLVAGIAGLLLVAAPAAVLAWPQGKQQVDNTTGDPTGDIGTQAPVVPGKPAHVWSYDVGSPVSGRPAVAGDAVYVGDGGGKVHAIDRATGKDRWRYDAGAPVNAAPQVRDGVVYIASKDGMVHAISAADGARRWRVRAGSGSTSSPVITNDALYVGGDDGLYAFRLDGQPRWRFRDGGAIATTPAASGDTVYASGGDGRVFAVNAGSGNRRWATPIGDGLSAPAAGGGMLFVGSAGRLVHALDAGSGKVRWTFPATGAVTTAPLADGGAVYFGASDGLVYAVNATDGTLRWRYTVEGGQPISASPSIAERVVYVGSRAGRLYALEAASGAPLWQFTTEGAVAGTALADRVLYVAGGNRVYALQLTMVSAAPTRSPPP
jgi:molecular chaperone DnaK